MSQLSVLDTFNGLDTLVARMLEDMKHIDRTNMTPAEDQEDPVIMNSPVLSAFVRDLNEGRRLGLIGCRHDKEENILCLPFSPLYTCMERFFRRKVFFLEELPENEAYPWWRHGPGADERMSPIRSTISCMFRSDLDLRDPHDLRQRNFFGSLPDVNGFFEAVECYFTGRVQKVEILFSSAAAASTIVLPRFI
jgi:hypothetical protein